MSSKKNNRFYVIEEEKIVASENGTTIEQMHLSYKQRQITLHINPHFIEASGLNEEKWAKLKPELEHVLESGEVFVDSNEDFFRFDLKSPHDIRFDGDFLELEMELKGTSDRQFYDAKTAKRFTTLLKQALFEQQDENAKR